MNDAKIKFAVVVCVHIGKRHAEIITQNKEREVVALIDTKPTEALGIDQYRAPFFSSFKAFFNFGIACDVVNIATPNGLHAEQALQCLEQKNMLYLKSTWC